MTSHSLHLLKPLPLCLVVRGAKKFFLVPILNPSYADPSGFPSRPGWRDEDRSGMDPRAAPLSPTSSKARCLLLPGGRQPPPRSPSQSQMRNHFCPLDFRPWRRLGVNVCPPKGGMGRGSREGLSRREAGRGGGVGGQPERGRGVGNGGRGAGPQGWEREPRGGREAREREASYQTLSRRSNYCQLGTPRLCRLS